MIEKRRHLFTIWIPGQVPGGKNRTIEVKEPHPVTGKMMIFKRPRRRRSKRTGRVEPSPFERWRDPAVQYLWYRRPSTPYTGYIRATVDYWWRDRHTRDEDGRSGCLGHVLQAAGIVADDKLFRCQWLYCGHSRDGSGVRIIAFTEPEITGDPKDGGEAGPYGQRDYAASFTEEFQDATKRLRKPRRSKG